MKASDLPAFTRVLSRLSGLYGQAMSPGSVELYWSALQTFELTAIKQALSAHTLHPDGGKFMPKPAEVVRALQGDSRTQGLQAWTKVAQAIREVGSYASVVFDDPLIHAVIRDMGGWITLCEVKIDELPFREKDFVVRYAGYVGYPAPPYPAQLTGRLAHQHQLQQGMAEAPVCIGEVAKAQFVYQQGQCSAPSYARLPLEVMERSEAEVLP